MLKVRDSSVSYPNQNSMGLLTYDIFGNVFQASDFGQARAVPPSYSWASDGNQWLFMVVYNRPCDQEASHLSPGIIKTRFTGANFLKNIVRCFLTSSTYIRWIAPLAFFRTGNELGRWLPSKIERSRQVKFCARSLTRIFKAWSSYQTVR